MIHQTDTLRDAGVAAKDRPHVFQEAQLPPISQPFTSHGGGPYTPPAVPPSKARVCALCGRPSADRVHIEGEARADAESPRWGL
jgi:hypothetical protein